jgi:hypothetical protein
MQELLMSGRVPRLLGSITMALALSVALGVAPVGAANPPSGERIHGQSSVEPVYNDMTGAVAFVATPINAPNPVHANPRAWAPIYLPVYPTGSTVGILNCMGAPGNCPDHAGIIAKLAAQIDSGVYGDGVIGHDHLLAPPASGGDFNIAWEPVLVLFTSKDAANEHITTLAQINDAVTNHRAFEVPLPPATFLCAVVPAVVYWNGTPVPVS